MGKRFAVTWRMCSDQEGAEGREAHFFEKSRRTMPWGGHQELPHSCHDTDDKAGGSVCLPGDSPQC